MYEGFHGASEMCRSEDMVIQMGRSQIVTSMLTCFPVQLNMYTEILNSHRHFGHAVNRVQVK